MSTDIPSPDRFADLGLPDVLVNAVEALGYETPSPIQQATIPLILEGRDVLGQAQTGTGKTAAFALPLLARIDLNQRHPQALVLAPTRELAIQVAEAMHSYGKQMKGLKVLSVYGGQGYREQIQGLKNGVQVIVGTPGRIMDHMRRGTLKLDGLTHLVLDEADEMLRMGFIDDVEWILSHIPEQRQVSLFSATMPPAIRRIANTYLKRPEQVTIEAKTTTAVTIRQRFWFAKGMPKQEALSRILEAESCDGVIVFVRTKQSTQELAEFLQRRQFRVAALNGDIAQAERERTVDRLKAGKLDILVATDVVARGLDVERISHVINYDIPHDTEAYVHRIGRTGRAGREGDAILFVAPRERRMLQSIERATRQPIEEMALPSVDRINQIRKQRFLERLEGGLNNNRNVMFRELLAEYAEQNELDPLDLAAALAAMVQGDVPLLLKEVDVPAPKMRREKSESGGSPVRGSDVGMERYRIEVGRNHKVGVGNIVGAIANEGNIDSEFIGRIQLFDDFSLVDLPEGMPPEVLEALQNPRVAGQRLRMTRADDNMEIPAGRPARPPRKRAANKADGAEPVKKRSKPKKANGGTGKKAPTKPHRGKTKP
ncbi:DEAD/DEAH box helicase [Spongiibacter sp. KMU-158]|uniref:ATP-dependent RNA helicase DeaD n=1 Tax=Spongiibacter pelagi TaxID=2760804 RepID=A0A927GWS7_9GAMM|nr:DEAD/DEAH box helicase [Spongiibacter pelagi]MBD2859775.1 DEAD/DEAH box helicase [Spongiibacter pelagi]